METNRLMLGDWVGYIGAYEDDSGEIVKLWEKPIPIKITFITPDAVQYEDEEGCYECMDYELHPIPLTAEILERNGFRKLLTYGTEKWVYDNFRLNVYDSGETWRFCADTHRNEDSVIYIRFVHELQHALQLCGIEKEIEI